MGLENLDTHGLLLRDTLFLLREELKEKAGQSDDYGSGYRMGLARSIDLFQQQCRAFGVSEADLEIADFDLTKEV